MGGLDELAKAVGAPAPSEDLDDAGRWELYRAGLAHGGAAIEPLIEVLRVEPDECLVDAVLWAFVESVTSREGRAVALSLPAGERRRPTLEAHAADVDLLASILGGVPVQRGDVVNWSRWVQERVTARCTDLPVLSQIAAEGTTRRVRAEAVERIRQLETDAASRQHDPSALRHLVAHGSTHAIRRLAAARLRAIDAEPGRAEAVRRSLVGPISQLPGVTSAEVTGRISDSVEDLYVRFAHEAHDLMVWRNIRLGSSRVFIDGAQADRVPDSDLLWLVEGVAADSVTIGVDRFTVRGPDGVERVVEFE
ncbi:MAG: hypothetical protein L6367_14015 [Cellulomonas sp.]|nr:hypothetical protein [Cellulomonas sp.]